VAEFLSHPPHPAPVLTLNPHVLSLFARVSVICGFSLDQVLREVDPSGYDTADTATYPDIDVLVRLHEAAVAHSTRAHFPFVLGNYFAFDQAPEIDAYLASCTSLRQVLPLLGDLPILLNPELHADYAIDAETVTIRFDLHGRNERQGYATYMEVVIAVVTRLIEQMMGQALDFDVFFRHPPMIAPADYRRQYHTDPVFGAEHDGIRFPIRYLDLELPHRSATLHAKAQLRLERRLQELRADSGLAHTLEVLLSQKPSMSIRDVATRLKMGERSLQRSLKEAGTSFIDIQTAVRSSAARTMLMDRALDIDAIAAKLGFSDRTTFTRAFTKWTGVSPSQYRREVFK